MMRITVYKWYDNNNVDIYCVEPYNFLQKNKIKYSNMIKMNYSYLKKCKTDDYCNFDSYSD